MIRAGVWLTAAILLLLAAMAAKTYLIALPAPQAKVAAGEFDANRALRRLHRGIEQVALLLQRARLEFRQCAGLATGGDRVRGEPVGVGDGVEVGACGRRRGRFRLALLLRHRVRRGQRGDQAESDGEGQGAQVRHADHSRERKSRECNKASWRVE